MAPHPQAASADWARRLGKRGVLGELFLHPGEACWQAEPTRDSWFMGEIANMVLGSIWCLHPPKPCLYFAHGCAHPGGSKDTQSSWRFLGNGVPCSKPAQGMCLGYLHPHVLSHCSQLRSRLWQSMTAKSVAEVVEGLLCSWQSGQSNRDRSWHPDLLLLPDCAVYPVLLGQRWSFGPLCVWHS